jgi:hypothetical protein
VNQRQVEIYVPTGGYPAAEKRLARRVESLAGARIGVLDNCKEFADTVLKGVITVLQRDYGVAQVEFRRKPYPGAGAGQALLAEMAAYDCVINGVGH